ncbi:MAG: putative quinol monooxygenase [Myxococcota bacterium]
MNTFDDSTVIVLIEFDVMPHAIEAFAEAMRLGAAQRAHYPGCLKIDAYQSADDETLFTLIEVFETQAAIDAYYATALHAAWMASIQPLVKDIRGADQRSVYAGRSSGVS